MNQNSTDPLKTSKVLDIGKEIESTRKKLLDLTMRNKLLNFRPSKSRTIKIINANLSDVYDVLVLQGKAMQFQGATVNLQQTNNGSDIKQGSLLDSNTAITENHQNNATFGSEKSPFEEQVDEKHKDNNLHTNLEKETLEKRLLYIFQDSRSVLEELGYSTLYIALGFLNWTESADSKETRSAPLILVPVDLNRKGVRASLKLIWNQEDISTNISLKEMLLQQDIKLPDFEMPEDKEGIEKYLANVKISIKSEPEWYISEDIYVGFFSFTKFIMYKDLDPAGWSTGKSVADHPLIRASFGEVGDNNNDSEFLEEQVDEQLKPEKLYHVLDADSSQIAVIEDVKRGHNLAVEGPPGTGKSQTIVNIIAELLALNKTVLFVSEKMAALEVVKNRLDDLGIGDFCLELHSRKTNKKEVLGSLEHTLNLSPVKQEVIENGFNELEKLKIDLNGYVKALREPFGKIKLSPYALFCKKDQALTYFEESGRKIPRIEFVQVESLDADHFEKAQNILVELRGLIPLIAPFVTNPWLKCRPGIILPSQEDIIGKLLSECLEDLNQIQSGADCLVRLCAVAPPEDLKGVRINLEAAKIIAVSKPISPNILKNIEWNRPNEQANKIIEKLQAFHTSQSKVVSKFKASTLEVPVNFILEEFRGLNRKLFKFFIVKYHRRKKEISALYNTQTKRSNEEIIDDLQEFNNFQELRNSLKESNSAATSLFGTLWQGENSEPDKLNSFSEWIVSFRKQLLNKALTENTVEIVTKGVSRDQIENVVKTLSESQINFQTKFDILCKTIGADYEFVFGNQLDDIPLPDMSKKIQIWKETSSQLQRWSQYISLRNRCLKTIVAPVINEIEKDVISANDLIPCFEGNFMDSLLDVVFKERPELASFVGDTHLNKIERFATLDAEIVKQTRFRLIKHLLANRPNLMRGASAGSEAGILTGEFNKKKNHMSIRKLMSNAGHLIQKIKPCFMMSPLSIAQFLDPHTTSFDVVIFDEASQVRPEDALGTLIRGNQVVVLGDTRQLPPTSFFDNIINDDLENDEENITPFSQTESILHQCRMSFPKKTLRWHYRSKHESLVAISNQEFYDNLLLLYPSPFQKSEELGLQFVHLPNTVYDRGVSQSNQIEARIIAERAIEHYRKYPNKSLGIGAFSKRQQQTILDEIELQLKQHPEMEEYFNAEGLEHFFVKNLETIQGDERDVIFISIGYGKDKFGKLTLNFGPLNNDGGQRRLNVLITRAREKCMVFSNFRGDDLVLDANASVGLRALKKFLQYAETRDLSQMTHGQDTDTPFEDAVLEAIKSHGYEVHKQVGCAGFRVDLAVVNPASPGNYLIAIECDGFKYHSAPVARDRDRLRQQILEKLGWKIYRIWSTDWYRNHAECEKRLIQAIEITKLEIGVLPPISNQIQPPIKNDNNKEETSREVRIISEEPEETNQPQNDNYEEISRYVCCDSLDHVPNLEIYEISSRYLSQIIVQVVKVESPVHIDEVIKRIRSLWGLKRSGDRIKDAINAAIEYGASYNVFQKKGEFLWSINDSSVSVRRRESDTPAKIELICDEEIIEAINVVLKRQYATLERDLITQSSRLLGMKATSTKAEERFEDIIKELLRQNKLQKMPNGMLNLPD